jgi:hypothetical protein
VFGKEVLKILIAVLARYRKMLFLSLVHHL